MKLNQAWFLFGVLILLSVLIAGILFQGSGYTRDSIRYVASAISVLGGHGYSLPWVPIESTRTFTPLTHYPPGFPLMIVILSMTGLSPWISSKILLSLFFILTGFLVVLITYRHTKNLYLIASAWILFSLSPHVLRISALVLSEGPFLTALMATFLLMASYMKTPSVRTVILLAFLTSIALLIRYAAAPLVLVVGLIILLWGENLWSRFRRILLYGAVFVPLPLAYFLRNVWVKGDSTGRSLSLYPLEAFTIMEGLGTIGGWFLPNIEGLALVGLLVLVVFAGASLFVWLWMQRTDRWRTVLTPVLFFWGYLAFLMVARMLLDPEIRFHVRLMLPAYVTGLVIIGLVGQDLYERHLKRNSYSKYCSLMVVVVVIGITTIRGLDRLGRLDQGLSSSDWETSQLVQYLKSTESGRDIFTNEPEFVFYYTRRPLIKFTYSEYGLVQSNLSWTDKVSKLAERMKDDSGYFVYAHSSGKSFSKRKALLNNPHIRSGPSFPRGELYR